MNLHVHKPEFRQLITITAKEKHIPEKAVEMDYYIVRALLLLSENEIANRCVFKGGTSLSKCYPGSIERFSQDIDLTFVPDESMSDKQIERKLKTIEKVMTLGANTEIISEERNERNKSLYFWYDNRTSMVKLEIGSSVRPEPYGQKTMRSYIQEYLENNGFEDAIGEYGLSPVTINVLNIERTFIDKIMSVRRHSVCGSITEKARHIYDVMRLFQMPEIKMFLCDKKELKRLVGLTKQTDSVYLEKRNIPKGFDPTGDYDFSAWKNAFIKAKDVYEHLHEELLYTDEKQDFNVALAAFEKIDAILKSIGE